MCHGLCGWNLVPVLQFVRCCALLCVLSCSVLVGVVWRNEGGNRRFPFPSSVHRACQTCLSDETRPTKDEISSSHNMSLSKNVVPLKYTCDAPSRTIDQKHERRFLGDVSHQRSLEKLPPATYGKLLVGALLGFLVPPVQTELYSYPHLNCNGTVVPVPSVPCGTVRYKYWRYVRQMRAPANLARALARSRLIFLARMAGRTRLQKASVCTVCTVPGRYCYRYVPVLSLRRCAAPWTLARIHYRYLVHHDW